MSKRKLGRKKDHRESMLANLATSIILYENVKTTQPKAKEAIKIVERCINQAKKNNLAVRRRLLATLPDKKAVKKIFEELIVRYKDRISGYAKIYKLGTRLGDGSKMVIIRLIPGPKQSNLEQSGQKTNKDKKDSKDENKSKQK